MDSEQKPRVAFHTLGCKLNFSESSHLATLLETNGYQRVDFEDQADIYVLNTCSVTGAAEKKCRNLISRTNRLAPEAFVVVTGCYAQLGAETISKMKGVDLVLGETQKFDLLKHLENIRKREAPEIHTCSDDQARRFYPSWSGGDRTRSFLKIQDGCDYSCSYCTIPLARGKSRNGSIAEILHQAHEIASTGVKEIVLTGVNIGDFGVSTNETFFELIRQLDNIEGIERFRISSIEPNLLNSEMIEWIAGSFKFAPHFHIPLQSGSDKILGLMRRRYPRNLFADRISSIRNVSPLASVGVDVIVGFPGEGEVEFKETYEFLNQLEISYLHVFSFSARPNTPAALMSGKVASSVKAERSKILHRLSEQKRMKFYQQNLGRTGFVLFENQNDNGKMTGFSGNYIRTECDYSEQLLNRILPVSFESINENGNMTGEIRI